MKFILTAIILAGAAFAETPVSAPTPQTIKVRVGFDKKRRPVLATAEVHTGFLQTASTDRVPSGSYDLTGRVFTQWQPEVFGGLVCAPDASYAVAAIGGPNPKAHWEMGDDVHFAVIGQRLYLIPTDALLAGVVDDAALKIMTTTETSNYEKLREITRKVKAAQDADKAQAEKATQAQKGKLVH
jgi:hypothetical protein